MRAHERHAELVRGLMQDAQADGVPLTHDELEGCLATFAKAAQPGAWPSEREDALVAKILARTTREDLSWRSEWRLLAHFLAQRVRTSQAWKLVAASLALHLFALPALGYFVWRERQAGHEVRLEFALPEADHSGIVEEPQPRVVLPPEAGLEPEPAARRVPREQAWNARRRARYLLQQARAPGLPVAPDGGADPAEGQLMEIALLGARSRWLTERHWEPWLDDPRTIQRASRGALTLLAELSLDRWLLDERPPLLGEVLGELERRAQAAGLRPEQPLERLSRRALDRGRAYGLWRAPADFEARTAPAPLTRAWFDALAESMSGPAHGQDRVWLAWRDWARRAR